MFMFSPSHSLLITALGYILHSFKALFVLQRFEFFEDVESKHFSSEKFSTSND